MNHLNRWFSFCGIFKLWVINEISTMLEKPTFADRLSDKIAEFGGSWTFVISFFTFLFLWILINLIYPFDPYPFTFLNLILSTLAAIQAPIIMMSQNRQEKKDRERQQAIHDLSIKIERETSEMISRMDKAYTDLVGIFNRFDKYIQGVDKT